MIVLAIPSKYNFIPLSSIKKSKTEELFAFMVRRICICVIADEYLLSSFTKTDGFLFPIQLKFDCNDKEQLKDIKVIRVLIDQIYQFSRMYWKSVRQQNLLITII